MPEGRFVFQNLTARENLVATAANRLGMKNPWTLERIYSLFPRLEERTGNLGRNLSGGEQQMLVIGRALMTNPRLLVLDEATEGLAPLLRKEIWNCLMMLKAEGQSIIVVDKNLDALSEVCDRHYILKKAGLCGPEALRTWKQTARPCTITWGFRIHYFESKRSRFTTLVQAATKSFRNFSWASAEP